MIYYPKTKDKPIQIKLSLRSVREIMADEYLLFDDMGKRLRAELEERTKKYCAIGGRLNTMGEAVDNYPNKTALAKVVEEFKGREMSIMVRAGNA